MTQIEDSDLEHAIRVALAARAASIHPAETDDGPVHADERSTHQQARGPARHTARRFVPPAGKERRIRLLVASVAVVAVTAGVVLAVSLSGGEPDVQMSKPSVIDGPPCPASATNLRPESNAPGSDQSLVPSMPHSVSACLYNDNGVLLATVTPYAADVAARPELAELAAQLNASLDEVCEIGRVRAHILVRFGYLNGSTVSVSVARNGTCSRLDNGLIVRSAPNELLTQYWNNLPAEPSGDS